MTLAWLNKDRSQQKSVISDLLDKLYLAQDTTIPATYIGTTVPDNDDFNTAWSNRIGYTAQPLVGSLVQWFDSGEGRIKDHYSKVPESGGMSSGVYHQHGYVDPIPWSKHVATIYADGVQTTYDIGTFPTNYREIVIIANVMSVTAAANTLNSFGVRKNGYSSTTHARYNWSQQGTGSQSQGSGTSSAMYAQDSLSKATKLFSAVEFTIPDYTGARDGRSTELNWKATSIAPLDDGTAGDDLNVNYSGGRSSAVGVIDADGITLLTSDGLALEKGTVISIYVRNPIPS